MYPSPFGVAVLGAVAIDGYAHNFQLDHDTAIGSGILTCGYAAGFVVWSW
jgi:hypothetical protein